MSEMREICTIVLIIFAILGGIATTLTYMEGNQKARMLQEITGEEYTWTEALHVDIIVDAEGE